MGKITFNVENGALNRAAANRDDVSGMVIVGASFPTGIQSGDIFTFGNLNDAINAGFTSDFDSANDEQYYAQLSDFYAFNHSTTLYIMVASGQKMEDVCDVSKDYLKKLIVEANGDIKQVGIAVPLVTATLTNGVPNEVAQAILKLKELQANQRGYKRPFCAILDVPKMSGTIAALADMRTNVAGGIGLCSTMDDRVKTSSVGIALGVFASKKVSENMGWVATSNVQDLANNRYAISKLTSGNAISDYEANFQDLHNKGFLFVRSYPGLAGMYFFDDANLNPLDHDINSLSLQRTIDKVERLLYQKLLPRTNSPVLVDPSSGKIAAEVAKSYEADGEAGLAVMLQNEELSGVNVYVNPDQDIITNSEVQVQYEIVPVGTARNIKNVIRLAVTLSS